METLGFQGKLEAWPWSGHTTMHMKPTITSSFPSNIESPYCKTASRSRLQSWQRKLLSATTLNSKRSDATKTTYMSLPAFLRNTAVRKWSECSKASLHVNYSSNFLCSRKNFGEENSGATAFTLPQYPSGEIGNRSSGMSQTRERRWTPRTNYDYSLKAMRQAIPCGLPQGC